jgi:hypothetical protein
MTRGKRKTYSVTVPSLFTAATMAGIITLFYILLEKKNIPTTMPD